MTDASHDVPMDKLKALSDYLYENYAYIDEAFEVEGGRYIVLTEEEANEEVRQCHEDANYAVRRGYLCKTWDENATRAELLAPYDGVERKHDGFYI